MGYKVGDRVLCLRSYRDQFTRGNSYIIASIVTDGPRYGVLLVARDDLGSTTNGWHESHFIPYSKLAEEILKIRIPEIKIEK